MGSATMCCVVLIAVVFIIPPACLALSGRTRFNKGQSAMRRTRGFPRQPRYQGCITSTHTHTLHREMTDYKPGFILSKGPLISEKECKHLHKDRHKGVPVHTAPLPLVPHLPGCCLVCSCRWSGSGLSHSSGVG